MYYNPAPLLLLALVNVADARVTYTTNGVEQVGVQLITATDTGFSAAMAQVSANPKSALPKSLLNSPGVVFIKNAAEQNIARLSIRYLLDLPDRPQVIWVHTLMFEASILPGLRPGESVLAFPGVLQVGPTYARASQETIDGQMALLAQAKTVSIAVDFILFADGRMIGPDQNGESVRYRAQQGAIRDMLSALRQLPSSGAVDYLQRLKERAAPRPSAGIGVMDRSRDQQFQYDSMHNTLAKWFAFKGFNTQQAIEYLTSASEKMRDLK